MDHVGFVQWRLARGENVRCASTHFYLILMISEIMILSRYTFSIMGANKSGKKLLRLWPMTENKSGNGSWNKLLRLRDLAQRFVERQDSREVWKFNGG